VTDWAVLADFATAVGTALLAVATFAATRSGNRAARSAERALLEGLRPILIPSDWGDPVQKVNFNDGKWLHVHGGRAAIEATDSVVYAVLSIRNAGRGLAVLHGWSIVRDSQSDPHRDPSEFFRLTRDIYVGAGGIGFVQVAMRDPSTDDFAYVRSRVAGAEPLTFDVLYGDAEGTQRVISRFSLSLGPVEFEDSADRALSVGRHWNLDLPSPR
jgi:hypothetical protein